MRSPFGIFPCLRDSSLSISPSFLLSPRPLLLLTCIGSDTNKDPEGCRSIRPPSHQTASRASCLLTYENSFASQLGTENVISYPSHERSRLSFLPATIGSVAYERRHIILSEKSNYIFFFHFWLISISLTRFLYLNYRSTTLVPHRSCPNSITFFYIYSSQARGSLYICMYDIV